MFILYFQVSGPNPYVYLINKEAGRLYAELLSLACFWINLVLEIAFHTCFVFDLICLFLVNSVYLLCCFSRKFFSILSLIFG